MLWLRNVPDFKYILIHIGNTDRDTAGCILVGAQGIFIPGDIKVLQSAFAYRRLYAKVWEAALNENLVMVIEDNDLDDVGGNLL